MKRFLSLVALAIVAIGATAQMEQKIPLDPAVRMGKLDNGLTYYIRHNQWPEQRADFYIAQKVGSMQEEDDQRGLAHFLEHMCFNGTTHFPGDKLKSYLESIGVKFGENLNAYTSTDETVYNVNNVPVIAHPGAIDSCLLILHDWSHDLLLEDKEIDKERGVINEEWRYRQQASMRMYDQVFPIIYEGSKYAYRLPIGTMDVVMNFKYKTLRDYYKKWYRPDLQAIVVVGDIDVDQVEQKIKTIFADIKPVENPAERIYFPVPDNAEPVFAVGKDKEMTASEAIIMWKEDVVPAEMKQGMQYIVIDYVKGAIESMLNTRMAELTQKPNPPFIQGQAGFGEYLISKTKDAFQGITVFKDNEYESAIKALYREILRAKRFGFTESEYIRYIENLKSNLDNAYERRDKISNTSFCEEYYRNFLDAEPAMGIELEHQLIPAIADQIPVDVINQAMAQEADSNLVVLFLLPDKEGVNMPEKDQILRYMEEVRAENIEAYKEEVSDEPLVDESALKGSPVKKQQPSVFDSQLITLKNGIKIYVKKTDFTPNNISVRAVSWGGTSLFSNDEWLNADEIGMAQQGGFGNFSAIDLRKKLAGKKVSMTPSVGARTETIAGSCVTKDLETELQLIYLAFTSIRRDDDVFASTIQRAKASLENAELLPTTALQDSIASVIYNNNVRALRTKASDLDKLSYDRILEMYKERFADGDDFDFYFVGDIDIETARPLFEKYLGSIPVKKGAEKFKKIDMKMADGEITNVFQKKQETPAATVLFVYHTHDFKEDLRSILTLDMLDQVMNMKYTETVREDEGGAYSVGVQSGSTDYPETQAQMIFQLPTSPDKRQHMTEIIYDGVEDIVNNGPSAEMLDKAKQYLHRSHDENIKGNGYWLSQLIYMTRENKDYVTDYDKIVDSITPADVQALAKKLFKSGNRIEVGMTDDSQSK